MELLVGTLAAWGLIMLIWTIAGVILLPLRRREDLRLTVVMEGNAPGLQLQHWLRGLLWLREMGILWWNIVIVKDELDQEAEAYAEAAAERCQVYLLSRDEWKEWVER